MTYRQQQRALYCRTIPDSSTTLATIWEVWKITSSLFGIDTFLCRLEGNESEDEEKVETTRKKIRSAFPEPTKGDERVELHDR